MAERTNHREFVAELQNKLNEEQLALVDFDRLKKWLAEIDVVLEAAEKMCGDFSLLRRDYIERISGMTKALAVADRKNGCLESALAFVETLDSLEASELIAQYRRISACFRDAFPASFGLPSGLQHSSCRTKDLSVFK
ncbi:MAG: hypothetical protein OEW00_08340 [candidate division Zixibacteria bacterium]|nr:hypothetical protein [candidate division Zixibacteria bacterium]